jgi:8-amino-7-oxononanoate synthase
VEEQLAALIGCERAVLATSTLHVFVDLLPLVATRGTVVFVDAGLYPIARWGVERAASRGAPVVMFPQHDAAALRRAVERAARARPGVVADGLSATTGMPLPLRDYVDGIAARDGLVIVDDTQALGIMGRAPSASAPYGTGGGGSLPLAGIRDRRLVVVSSLAKAFGAPVAVVGGSNELMEGFSRASPARLHCSPPSAAAIAAAAHALEINRRCGDAVRRTLADRVERLRRGLGRLGDSPGLFPVQHVRVPPRTDPFLLHRQLWKRNVRTVLTSSGDRGTVRLGFVMTARHHDNEIDQALASLAELIGCTTPREWGGGSANGKSTTDARADWGAAGAGS